MRPAPGAQKWKLTAIAANLHKFLQGRGLAAPSLDKASDKELAAPSPDKAIDRKPPVLVHKLAPLAPAFHNCQVWSARAKHFGQSKPFGRPKRLQPKRRLFDKADGVFSCPNIRRHGPADPSISTIEKFQKILFQISKILIKKIPEILIKKIPEILIKKFRKFSLKKYRIASFRNLLQIVNGHFGASLFNQKSSVSAKFVRQTTSHRLIFTSGQS